MPQPSYIQITADLKAANEEVESLIQQRQNRAEEHRNQIAAARFEQQDKIAALATTIEQLARVIRLSCS